MQNNFFKKFCVSLFFMSFFILCLVRTNKVFSVCLNNVSCLRDVEGKKHEIEVLNRESVEKVKELARKCADYETVKHEVNYEKCKRLNRIFNYLYRKDEKNGKYKEKLELKQTSYSDLLNSEKSKDILQFELYEKNEKLPLKCQNSCKIQLNKYVLITIGEEVFKRWSKGKILEDFKLDISHVKVTLGVEPPFKVSLHFFVGSSVERGLKYLGSFLYSGGVPHYLKHLSQNLKNYYCSPALYDDYYYDFEKACLSFVDLPFYLYDPIMDDNSY